jgi:hypothetical protein
MLLKRQPSLPLVYCGIKWAGHTSTVAYVRRLGDVDTLKSLFILVWAENCDLIPKEVREMESSIRADFGVVGMEHHRKDLMERLDQVLRRLDSGEKKRKYSKLRDVLLEIDRQ